MAQNFVPARTTQAFRHAPELALLDQPRPDLCAEIVTIYWFRMSCGCGTTWLAPLIRASCPHPQLAVSAALSTRVQVARCHLRPPDLFPDALKWGITSHPGSFWKFSNNSAPLESDPPTFGASPKGI